MNDPVVKLVKLGPSRDIRSKYGYNVKRMSQLLSLVQVGTKR